MIPTDGQLNAAMARACGWRSDGTWNGRGVPSAENWYDPKQERTAPSVKPPDFCTDRNTLPDVWCALDAKGRAAIAIYLCNVGRVVDFDKARDAFDEHWMMLNAPLRVHVVAALRALCLWQAEWEDGE